MSEEIINEIAEEEKIETVPDTAAETPAAEPDEEQPVPPQTSTCAR